MKKIQLILLLFLIVLITFSCEESTAPIDDKKTITCDTFPHWLFYVTGDYKPLYEVVALSVNQQDFVYRWSAGYFFFSKIKNTKTFLDFDKLTKGELRYYGVPVNVLPCPYDENVFMFVVEGYNKTNETITHWYLYNTQSNTFTKVTPSQYKDSGIKEKDYPDIGFPITWFSTSTNGNDQLNVRFLGTYNLQNEEFIDRIPENIGIGSISIDNKFKWFGYKNIKFGEPDFGAIFLNGVKIEGRVLNEADLLKFSNGILFSSDSKYIAVIAQTDFVLIDSLGDYFKELHIINVEKTLAAGRVVIDKSLSLKDHFCSFRAGIYAQYVNKDKVLVSWSYQYDDRGTIYEVDMNTGKAIPLVYD
ncbi:MAG: hypothetical protein JNL36_07420 [Candidatus Kapabacteria bacterium]|jgi:hypothetical protein|nr:hypothetical protein [Candidatus Kapabacteria bacterium]